MENYLTVIINVSILLTFIIVLTIDNRRRNKKIIELKKQELKNANTLIDLEKGRNFYSFEEQKWFSFIVASLNGMNLVLDIQKLQEDFRDALDNEEYLDAKDIKAEINDILNKIVENRK